MDAVLHALADETRRKVLEILRDHPASAGELAAALPIARPGVSRHLRVLRDAGLLEVHTRTRSAGFTHSARKRSSRSTSGWVSTAGSGRTGSTPSTPRSHEERRHDDDHDGDDAKAGRNPGAVRVEDLYDTDIDDLWQACTTPERLARWSARVDGDLRVGGTIQAVFTSSLTGPARIEACDAPHHLLLTTEPGTDDEGQIEARLTEEGSKTRLVVEERGLPMRHLPLHASGWRAHLEDLARSLEVDGPVHPEGWSSDAGAPGWKERWEELTPTYQQMAIG